MADRTPVFEMHIRPLFRLVDRQHMLRVRAELDLWNYDAVKTFAPIILQKIGGPNPSMPTPGVGGAWPSRGDAAMAHASRWIVCAMLAGSVIRSIDGVRAPRCAKLRWAVC